MNLEDVYQDIILDYSKRSDLKYDMKEATHIERGHNPNCGDDLTLLLQAEDGIIKIIKEQESVSYQGLASGASRAPVSLIS